MLSNNLKLIFRGLVRSKFYSLSTIIGFGTALTIGTIATSFFIYEKNTDSFLDQSILRVTMTDPYFFVTQPITYNELTQKLRSDFPEVSEMTHILYPGYVTSVLNQQNDTVAFKEKGALYCDEYFFTLFDYKFLSGDRKTCLKSPHSIVLTKERAIKYFGSTDIIDKSISIYDELFTVTGVLDDVPNNTHLKLSMLISYSTLSPPRRALDHGGFTYLKLNDGANTHDFVAKLNENKEQLLTFKPAQWPEDPFQVESISDAYYYLEYKEYLYEVFQFRDKNVLFSYTLVSIVILIVAFVNFIIYFYSKTVSNSKHLVIKRVFGAGGRSIFLGFAIEAFITLALGFCSAMILSIIFIPLFNEWAKSSIPTLFVFSPEVFTFILAVISIASVVLGLLFYLLFRKVFSRMAFNGNKSITVSKNGFLNGLMLTQLTFSVTLIMLFFMINDQIISISNFSLGYDKDNLLEIDLSSFPPDYNPQTIKTEFLKNHNVKSASISFGGPMSGRWSRNYSFNGSDSEIGFYQVDSDFIATMGLTITEGENFKPYFSNDSSYLIINETAASFFEIDNIDSLRTDLPIPGKIVGVIKDFHNASLKDKITPAFLEYVPYNKLGDFGGKLILRVHSLNEKTITSLATVWDELPTNQPMEYNILKDTYLNLYKDRFNESKLLSVSILGTMLVTCFGIIGFTSFSAQRRLKEMAIRKVLGASVSSIYFIWFKTLSIGVIAALLISIPIALYFIDQWTSVYVYKQPVSYLSIPLALIITLLAVFISSYYNVRYATTRNAVEVLKYE